MGNQNQSASNQNTRELLESMTEELMVNVNMLKNLQSFISTTMPLDAQTQELLVERLGVYAD